MKNYDIMGKRKIFFGLSLTIILIGLISGIFVNKFKLDIQYTGGTQLTFEMKDSNFKPSDAIIIAKDITGKEVTAQSLANINPNDQNTKVNLLLINVASAQKLTNEQSQALIKAIQDKYSLEKYPQVNDVDPSIGKELLGTALKSLGLAFFLIIIYIAFRFKAMSGFMAAIFAIVGLLSDMTVMFTVYTVFSIPVNDALIAAVLTILGYSLNDTIIVYDRIRENANTLNKLPVFEVLNRSIVQTLNRTLNTSLLTFTAITCVYVMASINNIPSLKDFSFPLMVGIVSGTYSSIFVSVPLWGIWKNSQMKKRKIVTRKSAKA